MAFSLGILSAAGGRQYATLDPVRHNNNITISNGNLTGVGSSGVGIATVGKSSDKWYWETTINSISISTGDYGKTGITNILMVPTYGTPTSLGGTGAAVSTVGYRGLSAGTQARANFGVTAPVAGNNIILAAGDVVSTALDMPTSTVFFYVNNDLACSVTLPGGSTWYPAFQALSGTPASSVTFNFGQNTWDARTAGIRASLFSSGYTIGLF